MVQHWEYMQQDTGSSLQVVNRTHSLHTVQFEPSMKLKVVHRLVVDLTHLLWVVQLSYQSCPVCHNLEEALD